jgi:hypothetical protein
MNDALAPDNANGLSLAPMTPSSRPSCSGLFLATPLRFGLATLLRRRSRWFGAGLRVTPGLLVAQHGPRAHQDLPRQRHDRLFLEVLAVYLTDSELKKPRAKERVHCFEEATGKAIAGQQVGQLGTGYVEELFLQAGPGSPRLGVLFPCG